MVRVICIVASDIHLP